MKSIIGQKLPVSREATIKLRFPSQRMVSVGTPRECCVKFMDLEVVQISYKYSWWRRHWYSFLSRHGKWKEVDGQLQG